jgi:uncharacterized protein
MDDQREVIAFLADGASYGMPGATVERIATHCSMIFLVGERAYKLKRAVLFSYLDYSTVARRERFCRAELALNRRTAPEIYLALRVVTREPQGLTFDGGGPVLDWVVEMRRFGADALFEQMAEAGRLDAGLMRELADAIAAFHDAAEVTPTQGGAAALDTTLIENDRNLRLAAPPLDDTAIGALRDAARARLAQVTPLLDARRGRGRVRRCHGDLHLGNVCLFDGRPTLFDCIEFNDAFSCIDTLYDIAFLLMDLAERGLGGLANLVFNRYLERSGDSGGLAALPLFLSARAGVRAHVLGARMRAESGEKAAATTAQARAYLAFATAVLREHPPRLIAVGGLSGSGKSTVAQALAANLPPTPGARIVRSDTLRKRLMQVAPETRLPRESYSLAAAQAVYAASRAEAASVLAAGYSAILDAAFLRADERQQAAAVARQAGVPFTGLWLQAPAKTLASRLDNRHGDASDADRAVLEQQLGFDIGSLDWHVVDASGDLSETTAAARRIVAG